MAYTMSDKQIERCRYDQRARESSTKYDSLSCSGSSSIPLLLRQPYIEYEIALNKLLAPGSVVLELCAGMGEHTGPLVDKSGHITATDISPESLVVLRKRFSSAQNLETLVCDIEQLPFPSQCFDVVACAGGLSYGDNLTVMREIFRVLKPGGHFVSVDSLNNNPIYKVNRYFHYLKGRRSLSTLRRMPTLSLIRMYQSIFTGVSVKYFGAFAWFLSPLSNVVAEKRLYTISCVIDNCCNIRWLAFKFLLVVRKSSTSND